MQFIRAVLCEAFQVTRKPLLLTFFMLFMRQLTGDRSDQFRLLGPIRYQLVPFILHGLAGF